jgi:8-oxo-dGTP pyrophosphatase MutT (NUDIX family)
VNLAKLIETARSALQGKGTLKTLFGESPWIQVVDYQEPPHGQYTYVHEPRTNGQRVAVLPFRDEVGGRSYLMRAEGVVPWMDNKPQMRGKLIPCALTGGMEDPEETPSDAAMREMQEEAGLVIPPNRLIDLGVTRTVKCLSTVYHLFGADVTGVLPKLATTDGSGGEDGCRILWTRRPQDYHDAIASVMWARLQR